MRCSGPVPAGTPPVRAPDRGLGTRAVRSYAVIPLRYATGRLSQEPCDSVPRSVRFLPVRQGARRGSVTDVVAQLVALGLQLGEPVLDDVADRHDGGEAALGVDDRHVSHAQL